MALCKKKHDVFSCAGLSAKQPRTFAHLCVHLNQDAFLRSWKVPPGPWDLANWSFVPGPCGSSRLYAASLEVAWGLSVLKGRSSQCLLRDWKYLFPTDPALWSPHPISVSLEKMKVIFKLHLEVEDTLGGLFPSVVPLWWEYCQHLWPKS